MKWITREKVKVDWDGTVYDVPSCELGHHGEEISFDAILHKHGPTK